MDIKKAYDIVESLGVVNVNYKGRPVWIESINSEGNEILVRDLQSEEEFTVDVLELKEDSNKSFLKRWQNWKISIT